MNHAAAGLPGLSRDTGMTVLLSIWADQGATVVRWERGASPTVTSMGLGTTLPLLNSSTGRAFLAWAPRAPLQRILDSELRRVARNPALIPGFTANRAGIDELTTAIRKQGFSSVDGKFIPGLVAAAAPILDWQHQAQAVITVVGVDPAAIAVNSTETNALKAFCESHSVRRDVA